MKPSSDRTKVTFGISGKGNPLLVIDGYIHRFHKMLVKNTMKRRQCSKQTCKIFVKTLSIYREYKNVISFEPREIGRKCFLIKLPENISRFNRVLETFTVSAKKNEQFVLEDDNENNMNIFFMCIKFNLIWWKQQLAPEHSQFRIIYECMWTYATYCQPTWQTWTNLTQRIYCDADETWTKGYENITNVIEGYTRYIFIHGCNHNLLHLISANLYLKYKCMIKMRK